MTPRELLDLRKSKGLTQQQLAEHLEVTRLTIANWEKGKYQMPDDLLARITGAQTVERVEKPLVSDKYFKKLAKPFNGVVRTLEHPFWYLGVGSPYRAMLEAAGKQWRELATTRDLIGYTAPTPRQAYDMLLAHGCNAQASYYYIAQRMGYAGIPEPLTAKQQAIAIYRRDWAEFQMRCPDGGWREFEEIYPQHREQRPAEAPGAIDHELKQAFDDAFNPSNGE